MQYQPNDRILLAQLHLYIDNHLNDTYLAPPLTIVTAALLTVWVPTWQAVLWAVIELAVIANYIGCYRRFRAANPEPSDEPIWARRIARAHGAHMLSWSSIVVWAWQPGDFNGLIFTMIIIHLGLISLTASMSMPHRRLLYSDMSIPVLALIGPPLVTASAVSFGLAALGVFYSLLMLSVARRMHDTTGAALELRHQNEALIASLERQAKLDTLTGVANRRHFLETGNAEIRRASRFDHPMALLMLDIDHFKLINDTCGHLVGDRVIKAVADAAASELRHCDCLGRLGGEEFAVVLPETELAAAIAAAERLRETIAALQLSHGGQPLPVTVSIGVTALEAAGEPLSSLLHRADTAMYRAKNAGRNRVEVGRGPLARMAGPAGTAGEAGTEPRIGAG
ncbi:MAG: GGDEF domain-containing protein [Methylibium sp.]|uniref:GGDEF domain-containing protein n=1 Tax=Methylibium sp. TaxID=2067992 RepID=UPI00179DC964|nr:GGDEF domain-containing protein [Methylibium sp.]MBA3596747.1 GGDEF domain-containing protein [Methylibium sp.]